MNRVVFGEIACERAAHDGVALVRRQAVIRRLDRDIGHRQHVAYVGNDINDLECLNAVGLPIVVQDAHADVQASWRLRTTKPGGRGAVREVCDLVVSSRQRVIA